MLSLESPGEVTYKRYTKYYPENIFFVINILLDRNIIQRTKLAGRKLEIKDSTVRGSTAQNIFLTEKGHKIAGDLLFLREHPEIKVDRPLK